MPAAYYPEELVARATTHYANPDFREKFARSVSTYTDEDLAGNAVMHAAGEIWGTEWRQPLRVLGIDGIAGYYCVGKVVLKVLGQDDSEQYSRKIQGGINNEGE